MQPSIRPTPDAIYRELRERICLLDLAPGTRLTEEGLADMFGVSRTPIRQVLDRLEHERLIDQRPGAGATVAHVDTKQLRDVWAVRLKLAELTGEFVRLPASAHVLEQLDEIEAELARLRASPDIRALGVLYNRYHDLFLEVISNETLRRLHDQLFHQTARVWLQFLPEMDLDAEIDAMADEFERTAQLIRTNDGEALAMLRATHMRMLLDRFNEHVTRPIG